MERSGAQRCDAMYAVGQRVRIRKCTWVVLDDHDGGMGSGDRVLRVCGVYTQSAAPVLD